MQRFRQKWCQTSRSRSRCLQKPQLAEPAPKPLIKRLSSYFLLGFNPQIHSGASWTATIVRGVQRRIAEIFPSIAVKAPHAALQRGIDVASAIASLRSVIQAGAHLEFLYGAEIRQGRCRSAP